MKNTLFNVIVVGEDYKSIMEKYDNNIEVKPYVIYKKNDSKKLLDSIRMLYKNLLEKEKNNIDFKSKLDYYSNLTDKEYFEEITSDLEYNENGDAISTENPNGKWSLFRVGKDFSLPFKLKDGTEAYQAKMSDIEWEAMHCVNKYIYEAAWEMVVEDRAPQTEEEKYVYENMKNRIGYFAKFPSKEAYVMHSTAFWAWAIVDENGWTELESNMDQFDWTSNFYDKFIKNLPQDSILTVCECNI